MKTFNPSSVCVSSGSKVKGLGRLASLVVGDFAIGSLLDPIGRVIVSLNSKSMNCETCWLIENAAPSIIARQSVFEPLQTGIHAIDSLIPIGRGQRQLIVGDRQTGKTSIGLDTIFMQRFERGIIFVLLCQSSSCIFVNFQHSS